MILCIVESGINKGEIEPIENIVMEEVSFSEMKMIEQYIKEKGFSETMVYAESDLHEVRGHELAMSIYVVEENEINTYKKRDKRDKDI